MKKIILSIVFTFFFSSISYAGACLTTITTATTTLLTCGAGDILNISSSGSIARSATKAVDARNSEGASSTTVINEGLLSSTGDTVNMKQATGINKITNSGTIDTAMNESDTAGVAVKVDETDGTVIDNTGTISGGKYGIVAYEADNFTLTNSGTIKSNANATAAVYIREGENGTITNTGTLTSVRHGIRVGSGAGQYNNLTITNSGLIAGTTHASRNSIFISDDNNVTSGFNLITKGEGRYDGKIQLSDQNGTTGVTFFDFTLDCSISRDQDIEIRQKQNVRVINNLCGNDTYEILDSSKNPDPDNSETIGYLRIYGEDLDIDSHNKKFRTEIFLAKLNNIFTATQDNKEKSTYYSRQKRDDIYKNNENGVLGFFENKNELGFLKGSFISYSDQRASFNNTEYSGSKNLAIGLRKKIKAERFNASIVPVLGLSQNQIVDVETETNQRIEKDFSSQFAGVNASISRKIDYNNESNLTVEVNGTYGIHKLPKYLSNFTDGDLSVDDAIDQVLGAGFNVKYSKKSTNGFILEPYAGLSANNTLSNDVEIIADGESKEAGHVMNGVLAKKVGFNLTKNTENFSFAINFNFQDQDGLIENTANISLSKKIQKISKLQKEKEREIPELEKLFDQLQLAKENERLAEIAGKTAEENKIMKELIIKLLKENQKLKTENLLFNNQ